MWSSRTWKRSCASLLKKFSELPLFLGPNLLVTDHRKCHDYDRMTFDSKLRNSTGPTSSIMPTVILALALASTALAFAARSRRPGAAAATPALRRLTAHAGDAHVVVEGELVAVEHRGPREAVRRHRALAPGLHLRMQDCSLIHHLGEPLGWITKYELDHNSKNIKMFLRRATF